VECAGAIGGGLSVALGITSISLFFAVSIPIVYFSYQEMKINENQFQKQLEKNKQKLLLDIANYRQSIYKSYLIQKLDIDFNSYFEDIVIKDFNDIAKKGKNTPLYQILYLLHEQKNNLINYEVLFEQISLTEPTKPLPWYEISISSFLAFVGTFGSIAGCSAGVSGLLTGMGILSSLAAFPILGWSIIGAAVFVGIISAVSAANSVQ